MIFVVLGVFIFSKIFRYRFYILLILYYAIFNIDMLSFLYVDNWTITNLYSISFEIQFVRNAVFDVITKKEGH